MAVIAYHADHPATAAMRCQALPTGGGQRDRDARATRLIVDVMRETTAWCVLQDTEATPVGQAVLKGTGKTFDDKSCPAASEASGVFLRQQKHRRPKAASAACTHAGECVDSAPTFEVRETKSAAGMPPPFPARSRDARTGADGDRSEGEGSVAIARMEYLKTSAIDTNCTSDPRAASAQGWARGAWGHGPSIRGQSPHNISSASRRRAVSFGVERGVRALSDDTGGA